MAQVNPGRFVATNVTLYRLITLAYGKHCRLSQEQELISGGPEWRQSVAFDIQATLPEGSPVYAQQQMVTIRVSSIPLSTLINVFQRNVGRLVVDKTELKELIDIPEVTLNVGTFDIAPGAVTVWPEIMSQLGFRMDPTRGPAEVLVIDRADKPSEN